MLSKIKSSTRGLGCIGRVVSCPVSHSFSFSTASAPPPMVPPHPRYVHAPNGDIVEYPEGRMEELTGRISCVGLEAARRLLPDWNPRAKLVNRAKLLYLNVYRPMLLGCNNGMWIAVGSDCRIIVGAEQDAVADQANKLFVPVDKLDYHITCIGREVMCGYDVGGLVNNSTAAELTRAVPDRATFSAGSKE